EEAVRLALHEVVGAYAIVVLSKDAPDQLIAARKGSPLVIGIGEGEFFVASDATPIIEYTNEVVYVNDHELAVIKDGQLAIRSREDVVQTPYIQRLELELDSIEKGGYEHFMLKEIFEQPRSILDSMRGRLEMSGSHLNMAGFRAYEQKFVNAHRIIIVACGTSWHAGLVAEYLIEDLARIPVEVDSIARATDAGAYTHAGPEIGVASTKAFTAQVTVLALLAMSIGQRRGTLSETKLRELMAELHSIPTKVEQALKLDAEIQVIAETFKDVPNFLYLGRGYNFPVALEGALKLKEISYIHAEGYPAAEMKHGPIALIDENMPVVVIATRDSSYEKVVSNIQEVKARKGRIIAVVTEGDT
nr:hypothetical protein [Tanacetum cinerariifolium]